MNVGFWGILLFCPLVTRSHAVLRGRREDEQIITAFEELSKDVSELVMPAMKLGEEAKKPPYVSELVPAMKLEEEAKKPPYESPIFRLFNIDDSFEEPAPSTGYKMNTAPKPAAGDHGLPDISNIKKVQHMIDMVDKPERLDKQAWVKAILNIPELWRHPDSFQTTCLGDSQLAEGADRSQGDYGQHTINIDVPLSMANWYYELQHAIMQHIPTEACRPMVKAQFRTKGCDYEYFEESDDVGMYEEPLDSLQQYKAGLIGGCGIMADAQFMLALRAMEEGHEGTCHTLHLASFPPPRNVKQVVFNNQDIMSYGTKLNNFFSERYQFYVFASNTAHANVDNGRVGTLAPELKRVHFIHMVDVVAESFLVPMSQEVPNFNVLLLTTVDAYAKSLYQSRLHRSDPRVVYTEYSPRSKDDTIDREKSEEAATFQTMIDTAKQGGWSIGHRDEMTKALSEIFKRTIDDDSAVTTIGLTCTEFPLIFVEDGKLDPHVGSKQSLRNMLKSAAEMAYASKLSIPDGFLGGVFDGIATDVWYDAAVVNSETAFAKIVSDLLYDPKATDPNKSRRHIEYRAFDQNCWDQCSTIPGYDAFYALHSECCFDQICAMDQCEPAEKDEFSHRLFDSYEYEKEEKKFDRQLKRPRQVEP